MDQRINLHAELYA